MVMIKCFRAIGVLLTFDYSVQGKTILKSISQNYKKSFSLCILHVQFSSIQFRSVYSVPTNPLQVHISHISEIILKFTWWFCKCIRLGNGTSWTDIKWLSERVYGLTFRRQISMPIVSLHGVSFSGLAWTFKLLHSKHTEANI